MPLCVLQSVKIDNNHAAKIKNELLIPQEAAQITQYVVICVGALLFLIGTFLVARSGTIKPQRVSFYLHEHTFRLGHIFFICWITFHFKEFQSAAIGKK